MKIKITTVEEIEIDVQFPCYLKKEEIYYLIREIGDKLQVQEVSIHTYPEINTIPFAERIFQDSVSITQKEYEDAYNLALSALNDFAFPSLIKD
jgi:hypothetical protein